MPIPNLIGESIPMLDSTARVTGTVDYLINLRLPGMLVGKILRSTVPHAQVLNVNVPGFAGSTAVLTGADLENTPLYGAAIKDQAIVATDRVRYIGEPVAAIAAENLDLAEEVASLIDVEYNELDAVYDPKEALNPDTPRLHANYPNNVFIHSKLRHGNMETAFAQADEIFEDTFTSPPAQQASLEPHICAAQWSRANSKLTVWTASQAPYMVRRVLSEIFAIPQSDVRVIVHPLGGSYGGKGHIRIEPMVAALARKTDGRPVKLVLSRAEEFVTVTKHAAVITLKTGVRRDGTFTARQVTIHWGSGAYADASPLLVPQGMVRSVGPYRIPAVHVDSIGVYTNLPPAGAYRGAMSSQTTWAYESQMDIIAKKMGWDGLEFRLKNLFHSGEQFATGETLHDVNFIECLNASVRGLGSKPVTEAGASTRRGRGYAVMMKSTVATSKSQARLRLAVDGVLSVFTSTVEMGQGAHTALAQIAADTLGLPIQAVRLVGPDTDLTPFDSTTSASRSTNMMGNAIIDAGEKLKNRLMELAAVLFHVPANQLIFEDGCVKSGYVSSDSARSRRADSAGSITAAPVLARGEEILRLSGLDVLDETGEYSTALKMDPETGQGVSTPHWHQGAGAVDVEVDVETGRVTILRYSAASFAGRVVNPRMAKLQNDGNVIFGLGPTLLEEIVFDGGQATNANLSDYMIPSIRDIPLELISTCIESDAGEFHGIGEMTLPPVAPAVAGAIEDAVGVRIRDLPITAEKVLRALSAMG